MSQQPYPEERTRQLIVQLIDGVLETDDAPELNRLVQSDPRLAELVVDQLLLDSLLSEAVGTESLTGLVDLISEPTSSTCELRLKTSDPTVHRFRGRSRRLWQSVGFVGVVAAIACAFLVGRWENTAWANAVTLMKSAIEPHAEPVERVYLVTEQRSVTTKASDFRLPTHVRVATMGDRFWVEVGRDAEQWKWGREGNGALWMTLGPQRALKIEHDEIGLPLRITSELHGLEVNSLLNGILKNCRLTRESDRDTVAVITATPRWRWSKLRSVTLEIDRETKAVRKLVLDREQVVTTFLLIESRSPKESLYRAEGHLIEPAEVFTRLSQPDQRQRILMNRFGPEAERWIKK